MTDATFSFEFCSCDCHKMPGVICSCFGDCCEEPQARPPTMVRCHTCRKWLPVGASVGHTGCRVPEPVWKKPDRVVFPRLENVSSIVALPEKVDLLRLLGDAVPVTPEPFNPPCEVVVGPEVGEPRRMTPVPPPEDPDKKP